MAGQAQKKAALTGLTGAACLRRWMQTQLQLLRGGAVLTLRVPALTSWAVAVLPHLRQLVAAADMLAQETVSPLMMSFSLR